MYLSNPLFLHVFCSTGEERAVHTGPGCKRMKKQAAYDTFIRIFPVTLEGAPPRRPLRASHADGHDRQCYDQWRADQLQLRIQHIIGELTFISIFYKNPSHIHSSAHMLLLQLFDDSLLFLFSLISTQSILVNGSLQRAS